MRGTLHKCAKAGACSRRFSRPSCCARGNTCKRRTGPPQNMWCLSGLFCVAKCESEIAKTGRRRIPKDGIGRSHRDLAIRSLGSPVKPRFCAKHRYINSRPRCHAQVWHLSGRGVSGESEDAKTPLCITRSYGFARSRRDLTICVVKSVAGSSGFLFQSPRARAGTRASAELVPP